MQDASLFCCVCLKYILTAFRKGRLTVNTNSTALKLVLRDSLMVCVHKSFDLLPPKTESKTCWHLSSTNKSLLLRLLVLLDTSRCVSDGSKSPKLKDASEDGKREVLMEMEWEEPQRKKSQFAGCLIWHLWNVSTEACPFYIMYHILPVMDHLNLKDTTVWGQIYPGLNFIHCYDVSVFLWEDGSSTRLWMLQKPLRTARSTCCPERFGLSNSQRQSDKVS